MVGDERGQAYTLEAVIGALIITASVVFALNATVITPSTAGGVDPDLRDSLRQQADDILVTVAENDSFDLSSTVRYWDPSSRTFYGANSPEIGYGASQPPGSLGTLLNRTFTERGYQYNVNVEYLGAANASGPDDPGGEVQMVFRGSPGDNAVAASYTTTLFDNQTLSTDQIATKGVELWQFDTNATDGDDGYYPVPNAIEGPVYNVVTVEVVVW
jgi:hypothetical protein